MVDTELLEAKIRESGKKKKYLAQKCGLSTNGFRNCCRNLADFRISHIAILCQELEIHTLTEMNAIFFAGVLH